MEKQSIIGIVLVCVFLAVAIVISGLGLQNSEQNLPYTHSFTKAFCDSSNFCRDFEIFCENKEIISIRFTGAAIQFHGDWQDPRNEEMKIGNC